MHGDTLRAAGAAARIRVDAAPRALRDGLGVQDGAAVEVDDPQIAREALVPGVADGRRDGDPGHGRFRAKTWKNGPTASSAACSGAMSRARLYPRTRRSSTPPYIRCVASGISGVTDGRVEAGLHEQPVEGARGEQVHVVVRDAAGGTDVPLCGGPGEVADAPQAHVRLEPERVAVRASRGRGARPGEGRARTRRRSARGSGRARSRRSRPRGRSCRRGRAASRPRRRRARLPPCPARRAASGPARASGARGRWRPRRHPVPRRRRRARPSRIPLRGLGRPCRSELHGLRRSRPGRTPSSLRPSARAR